MKLECGRKLDKISWTDRIFSWGKKIIDVLFPKRCAGCRAAGSYLCNRCELKIFFAPHYGQEEILAVSPYRDPVIRRLIWLLKYRGIIEIAGLLAGFVYDALIEELSEIAAYRDSGGKILIVPVPLSPKRFARRGYNQAAEIARALAGREPKLFKCESENLIKIRETATQVSCSDRAGRLSNLHGAFRVTNRRALRGRTVILLDDVATTGATLAACARALASARPRRIIKVVVAA